VAEGRLVCCFVLDRRVQAATLCRATAQQRAFAATIPKLACDTAAQCTTFRGRVKRSEQSCLDRGGQSAGEGSVCTACEALIPQP
jgi:hypothetical protein